MRFTNSYDNAQMMVVLFIEGRPERDITSAWKERSLTLGHMKINGTKMKRINLLLFQENIYSSNSPLFS